MSYSLSVLGDARLREELSLEGIKCNGPALDQIIFRIRNSFAV